MPFITSGVRSKTKECGIFPANFVTVVPQRDEVVSELQQILKEWVVLLKDYYRVSLHSFCDNFVAIVAFLSNDYFCIISKAKCKSLRT